MGIDLSNKNELSNILKEIDSEENLKRKRRSFVSYDIYNNNQHKYVLNALMNDYPCETVDAIRKVTSINFAKRIVNVEANIYKHNPVRTFEAGSDDQIDLLHNIYEHARINESNKQLNRFYRLDEQCASMIVPNKKLGTLGIRKLKNWQYDVVPDPDWPEQALGYIIPVNAAAGEYVDPQYYTTTSDSDNINQVIADKDDMKQSKKRYVVWTDKYNFLCNGAGEILTKDMDMENPIGRLPIIDISMPKQDSFLLQNDNNLARFTIDFLCMVTDFAEIIRMQGFSQAVLSALEVPKNMMIGPHRVLFLEKKKKAEQAEQPEFDFASPSPDLQGSLDGLLSIVRLFLSSRGHKTNVITGSSNAETFNSGLERLLAMIEEHDSSIDDFSLFEHVEQEQFDIFKKYSNYLQDNPVEGMELHEDLRGPEITDEATMEIDFHEPQMLETEKERQGRLGERLENSTLTRKRYIMEMDNVSEERAMEIIQEIDQEDIIIGNTEQ